MVEQTDAWIRSHEQGARSGLGDAPSPKKTIRFAHFLQDVGMNKEVQVRGKTSRFRLAGGLLSITLSMGLATEVAATPLPVTSLEISTAGVVI